MADLRYRVGATTVRLPDQPLSGVRNRQAAALLSIHISFEFARLNPEPRVKLNPSGFIALRSSR